MSVENVTTFYIFRGLRVGSRGLDSKCQFQEEIIYNLFKVLMLVQIPMNMTYLWVKEILFEKFLTMLLFHLRIIHPFYLSLLLIAYRDCPSLWFTFSPKCSYFKDLRMRLQMRIELILKLQRKKNASDFIITLKAYFKPWNTFENKKFKLTPLNTYIVKYHLLLVFPNLPLLALSYVLIREI